MTYLDENDDENQFDVLGFLESGRKTIDDFHESEKFYVEDVDRGVYPRKLINMLIDMGLVDKFSPYKSSEKEIEEFEEKVRKEDDISEERVDTLTQYTSFGLTETGEDAFAVSKEREKETIKREKEIREEKKKEKTEKEEKKVEKKKKEELQVKKEEVITKERKTEEQKKTAEEKQKKVEKKESKAREKKPEAKKEKAEKKKKVKPKKEKVTKKKKPEKKKKMKKKKKTVKPAEPKDSAIQKVEKIEKEIESVEEEIDELGFFSRSEKKELEAKKEKLLNQRKSLQSKIHKINKSCPKCASEGVLYDGAQYYCPTCKFWWKK